MRSWSIPAGRLFGVNVLIHLSFLFLFPVFWITEMPATPNPSRVMALALIVFFSVLLRQLALALVASQNGTPAKAVILLPSGGLVVLAETAAVSAAALAEREDKREWQMAITGLLTNLVLALIAAGALRLLVPGMQILAHPWVHSGSLLRSVIWINVALAGINLLPAYPLDGGRMLRALLAHNSSVVQATRRAVSVAHSLALVLMFLGMLLYFEASRPVSVWLTMLGFVIFLGAQLEERSVFFQSVLESVRLEEIMLTDFATLSPADTLEDALSKAVHTLQDDFPVVRGSDLVGVISRQAIVQSLRSQGNGYVQAAMDKIVEAAQKTESLASAFRKLTARNLTLIPVVEEQKLVGIVTLQNLTHSMGLLAESRKLRSEES
jgi:Zn-dependent protease/CBS domain-containing protein